MRTGTGRGRRRGTGLTEAFPGLLGPGRRAAWRRFVLRRVAATALVVAGYALALTAGWGATMWR